jgi:hypothetical protein
MAAFIPGESPPEVRTPIFFIVLDIIYVLKCKFSIIKDLKKWIFQYFA